MTDIYIKRTGERIPLNSAQFVNAMHDSLKRTGLTYRRSKSGKQRGILSREGGSRKTGKTEFQKK